MANHQSRASGTAIESDETPNAGIAEIVAPVVFINAKATHERTRFRRARTKAGASVVARFG